MSFNTSFSRLNSDNHTSDGPYGWPFIYPSDDDGTEAQTINGTISAISSEGGFTTYTVTLAAYDLFPQFAVQPGQTTIEANPNTVTVYVDNNTQMINQGSPWAVFFASTG